MTNRSFTEENKDARVEMSQILARLDESSYGRAIGSGWTVSTSLCHLAFWDQRALCLLREWERSGKIDPSRLSPQAIDSINQAVNVISLAVPGVAAARLAMDAASAVDSHLEGISDEFADELLAAGLERSLRRALHRRHHLQQIRESLEGRPAGLGTQREP